MDDLVVCLNACRFFLPETFRLELQRLFQKEHLENLARKLDNFWRKGVPTDFSPPSIEVECTPSFEEAFAPFRDFLDMWYRSEKKDSPELSHKLADTIANTTCKNILVLLGMRFSPASITDHRGIPRTKDYLLKATRQIHSSKITVGARAWTKHVNRNADEFWGKVRGSSEDKNAEAEKIICKILDNATWRNVFGHHMHNIVYEARMISGHGARWGKDGAEFIGFLEPFLPCSSHLL